MTEANLEKAMRIYYFLLKEGELSFENNKELYMDYSDSDVREVLEILAKESDVSIERFNQVVYLIPDEENDVLGIKDMTLQKVISYDARKVDFYLSQYIITILIVTFFSGKGSFVKSRDFIRIPDLEEIVSERLAFAAKKKNIEQEQEEAGMDILSMYDQSSSLVIDEPGRRKTKYGYLRSVCGFMEKQRLLIFDKAEDEVRPTAKFTNLMMYHFLDGERIETIEKLLER